MAKERSLSVTHTTMMRWVHEYAPQLEIKVKKHLKKSNDSYRVDETYLKIKGSWKYLYRAVNSKGDTLDWLLSAKAAKRFFKKTLANGYCTAPRVINVDKNKAFPPAFTEAKKDKMAPSKLALLLPLKLH